jgi:hypothetical protein
VQLGRRGGGTHGAAVAMRNRARVLAAEDLGSEQAAAKRWLSPSDERKKEADEARHIACAWGRRRNPVGHDHARADSKFQIDQIGLPNSTSKV